MKKLVNNSKSPKELLDIIKEANIAAEKKGEYLSKIVFNEYCKENYGVSFMGQISECFSNTAGKRNGWTKAKELLGLKPYKFYTDDEILEHLYQLYLKLGKQPTEEDINKSGISPHAVANHWRLNNPKLFHELIHQADKITDVIGFSLLA